MQTDVGLVAYAAACEERLCQSVAYFVYVDGTAIDRHGMINKENLRESWMKFNNFLFSYEGDDSWVEDALFLAKKVVQQPDCPEHSDSCEHKDFYVNYGRAMGFRI